MNPYLLKIKQACEEYYSVDLLHPTHKRVNVEARQMYCHLSRNLLQLPYDTIGVVINKNHATVMHGINRIKGYIDVHKETEENYLNLKYLCLSEFSNMGNPFNKYLTKEDVLQRQVLEFLKLQYPNAFVVHIPNEGKRTKFEQFKFKTLGGVAGMPDLMIFDARGKHHGLAIELKAGYNKPTENQLKCLQELQKRDWVAFWSNDFEYICQRINSYFNERHKSD